MTSNLIALIYAVQHWIPQFSVRTMMVGMTVVASLIAIGQAIFSSEYYDLQIGFDYYYLRIRFLMSVYFSPIVAALAFMGHDASRRQAIGS